MAERPTAGLEEHFGGLTDPRVERTREHKLLDIIVIAILAVICGADSWVDIELFGHSKEGWLKSFLELPNGIPSHDTFGRVFARLNPDEFQAGFVSWIRAVSELTHGQVIAVDGKTVRGSHDRGIGKQAIHMVSAWASINHLVLGQVKVDDKSNEITAIPELLRVLDISGCIISIDAMGCQKAIAEQIVNQGGAYMLSLKENQPNLLQDVQALFEWSQNLQFHGLDCDYHQTVNKDHGRIETRQCWALWDETCLAMLSSRDQWKDLRLVVKIHAERRTETGTSSEDRYYLSSCAFTGPGAAQQALEAVRSHWTVENQLHWVLDLAFREDGSRVRKDHSPQNFAILRHIAVNLLKQDKSVRAGIKAKRLRAGWDEAYLLSVLAGLK